MSEAVRWRSEEWLALQAQIADLLSRHGRNARQDGDYCLIDRDFGTYEQKVLVFFKDALSPELVEATENLLSNYSREWHVSFVEANKDGTEMVPPGGLKVSAYGLELLQRAKVSPEEDRETRRVYVALDELLVMVVKGSLDEHHYETMTSRLKSVTDALSQAMTFTYAKDDLTTGMNYTGPVHTTPKVSFACDPYFPRLQRQLHLQSLLLAPGLDDRWHRHDYVPRCRLALGRPAAAAGQKPASLQCHYYAYDELGRLAPHTRSSAPL